MTRKSWPVLALLSTAALVCGPVLAQAQKAESLDDLSEDNDLIQQIDSYAFTVDQLKAIVPVLQPIEQKRAALAAFKESEEALRPLRAVREALLKGAATDELQKAADDVWQKAQKLEAEVDEAIPEAMKRIADLLTEEQLATLTQGSDAAATLADGLFSDLDNARGLDDAGFAKWRDDKAHEVAVQAAGEEEQKVGAIEGGLKQFLSKARRLSNDDFVAQSDALFDELQNLLAGARPTVDPAAAKQQAAEQLGFILRSARAPAVIQAMVEARK